MESQPVFSIVIATYNYGRFIDQALDSALSLRFPRENIEVIVVDDGSTDDTSARLASYAGRVCAIYQPNQGEIAAYRAGIQAAKGHFIAFLDADDYFYLDKLSAVMNEFNRTPGVGVVYNRFDLINEDCELLQSRRPKRIRRGSLGALTRYRHLTGAPTSGITIETALLKQYPIPVESWRTNLDHFYLSILPLVTRVGYVAEPMHAYRQHAFSQYMSQSRERQNELGTQQKRLIWAYARERLGQQFFDEVRLDAGQSSPAAFPRRLHAARIEAGWVFRDNAPTALRLGALAKITARGLLPPDIYHWMQLIRRRLWA